MSIHTDIAIPKTISEYIEHKETAFKYVEDALKLLDMAEAELNQVAAYLYPPYHGRPHSSLQEIKDYINRALWRKAFDATGFLQLMDQQAADEFRASLEKDSPDFSLENIRATFIETYQQKDELFVRGLVNVFRRLSRNLKTNKDAFKVAEKIIIGFAVSPGWGHGLQVNHRRSDEINDIDRVFKVLDDKQHHPRSLETQMNAAWKDGVDFEDEYYKARPFKNGNLHLWIKRQDLLDKANEMIHDYYHENALGGHR